MDPTGAGHTNSHVTRTIYKHQIADRVSKAAGAMNTVFGQAGGA